MYYTMKTRKMFISCHNVKVNYGKKTMIHIFIDQGSWVLVAKMRMIWFITSSSDIRKSLMDFVRQTFIL